MRQNTFLGYFGDHFGDCLSAYGAHVTHVRAAKVGQIPTLASIKKALLADPALCLVTLTHVDTSTGVRMDVKAIAQMLRACRPDILLVVDGVCATGGEECRMADWDLDVVMTGSQKCLGVPAGLSISVVSPRALGTCMMKRSSCVS